MALVTTLPPPPPRLHRRLDLKVYSPEQLPFALLYFTGSDYFNRSMRWWAKKHMGISLNDKTMNREQGNPESRIHGVYRCEADVFKALDLEYVSPPDRSI
eukprot:CAMPEP_0197613870 /NCGR_PEP_ID=MMETSP1326-20131121/59237_1 /TAXON_ID=1155430 /ORGANISM="Genus nov. species nov., Strain RCC2288" /LENGTH=99 /DNA_ID=CAMNT_0043182735 /DNA_START=600 /DNA_END=899 /DNA_ORIENTATION=-